MTSIALEDVKTLDQGMVMAHVVRMDFAAWGFPPGPKEALVFPIMKRRDGLMCAVPEGFFPTEVLDGGNFSEMEDLTQKFLWPSKWSVC